MVLRRSPLSLTLLGLIAAALAIGGCWWTTGGPFGHSVHDVSVPFAASNQGVNPAGATDSAVATLQAQVRQRPDLADGWAHLGAAYLQKARETADPSYYIKADEVLNKALALDGQNFAALTGLGSLALSRHQFREALDLGQRAQAINPYNAGAYGIVGDAHVELGEYDAAVASFQKMVDTRPDLSSYSRVSYARELYGQDDAALDAMIKAANAGGPSEENTAWTMVQVGNLYFNRNDYANAERYYRHSLSIYKDYAHGYAGLAKILAARGKYSGAITLYSKVTRALPLPEYVIALGDVQRAAGKTGDAARTYELVGVEEQLFQAANVDQDLETALFDVDHGRNLDGVLAQATAAQQRRPSTKGDDVLAWTEFKTGDVDAAWQTIQRALRLGTDDPLMLYHAGAIADAAGAHAEARGYLERALRRNPHFSVLYERDAAQLLNRLKRAAASAQSDRSSAS